MSDYRFLVEGIEWPIQKPDLPDDAYVFLSDDLVDGDEVDERTWENAINDQLEIQFGYRGSGFGYTLDEDDDEDDEVSVRAISARMPGECQRSLASAHLTSRGTSPRASCFCSPDHFAPPVT